VPEDDGTVLAVSEALDRLAVEDPQCAELIKLRFVAGLPNVEAARILGMAAKRTWAYARARLYETASGLAQDIRNYLIDQLRGIEWPCLWQASRGDQLRTFPLDHFVSCVCLSPEAQLLATHTFSGSTRVIEISSGRAVATFAGVREKDSLDNLAFSRDGKLLAEGTAQNIVIRDTATWQAQQELQDSCEALAFLPDGGILAVLFGGPKTRLRLGQGLTRPFFGVSIREAGLGFSQTLRPMKPRHPGPKPKESHSPRTTVGSHTPAATTPSKFGICRPAKKLPPWPDTPGISNASAFPTQSEQARRIIERLQSGASAAK